MRKSLKLIALLFALLALPVCVVEASPLLPEVANPGFEEQSSDSSIPGWSWGVHNGCKSSIRFESTGARSGKGCVVISNESVREPDVYARLQQVVPVLPGVEYEISAWVKGEDVRSCQDFTDWRNYSLPTPIGTFDWQRISVRFRTSEDQTSLNLGINIVDRCKMLAIDDITLRPLGTAFTASGVTGEVVSAGRVMGDDQPAYLGVVVDSRLTAKATCEVEILSGKDRVFSKTVEVAPGPNAVDCEWNTGRASHRFLHAQVRLLSGGKAVASAERPIEKISFTTLSREMDLLEARVPEFRDLYAKCAAKGIPMDYPLVTKTLFEQFIPLTRYDLKMEEYVRAANETEDLHRAMDETLEWMRYYLKNPKLAPVARRYQTGKVDIQGQSFIGDRKDSRGKKDRGPLFFIGYGHFSQLRKDIARFPGYGVNIVQHAEFGPSAIFPTENEIDLKPVQTLIKALDDAAKNNVKIDVLLSTHYFPGWALAKWPQIAKPAGGFFPQSIDMPEAKYILERFFRIVIPMIKDHPALHSVCLSNEPLFHNAPALDNSKGMWRDYLAGMYGDIKSLNETWGTDYADFNSIPMQQSYDYWVFAQERFAAFHKWMADVVHEMAPNLPTHAKITMEVGVFNPGGIASGLDPELLGQALDLNGNDCIIMPDKIGGWGIWWYVQNPAYDMQRSFVNKPIFNSENHITRDGSPLQFAPENFRMALWQGAIHGQGATTIWIWERAYHKGPWEPSFYGNVMDHPLSAREVGLTCLDLNRFAEEVTALQRVKSPVAILFSRASAQDRNYIGAVQEAYIALNFLGVPVSFISDKQMARGEGAKYRLIMLPSTTMVPADVFQAIRKLPAQVKLAILGNALQKDPYGKEFPADQVSEIRSRAITFEGGSSAFQMWSRLLPELRKQGVLSDYQVVDTKTGKPAWGVEWLPAKANGRTVMNIINLLEKPVEVRILRNGKQVPARDLLSLGGQTQVKTLKPIVPVLAEIAE